MVNRIRIFGFLYIKMLKTIEAHFLGCFIDNYCYLIFLLKKSRYFLYLKLTYRGLFSTHCIQKQHVTVKDHQATLGL